MRSSQAGEIGGHTTNFLVVGLFLGLSACSESPLNLTWPSEVETFFMVVVPSDWRGQVDALEIEGPVRPDSVTRVDLEIPSDAEVFLVAPNAAAVQMRSPRATNPAGWRLGARSDQLAGDPSCGAAGWSHGDDELELPVAPLDGHALVFRVDDARGQFVVAEATPFDHVLSFRVPIEPCFDGKRIVVRGFASGPETKPALVTYRRGRLLDEDTVFAWSGDAIDVVTRGEDWEGRRSLRTSDVDLTPAPPEQAWRVDAAALGGSANAGRGVAAFSLGSIYGEVPTEARIYELHLDEDQLSVGRELWRTYEPGRTSPRRIEEVAVDARGTWVAVGEGLVLTASTTSSAPVVFPQPGTFDGLYLEATGSSSKPFLVGGRSFLRWFNPRSGEGGFDEIHFPLFDGVNRILDDVSTTRGLPDPTIVAVVSTLQVARSSPGASSWVSQPAPATNEEVGCVHAQVCGRPFLTQRNGSVVSGPPGPRPSILLAPTSCGAAYLIDEENTCAISTVLSRSSEIIETNSDDVDIYAADQLGDTTVLFGERARILVVTVE